MRKLAFISISATALGHPVFTQFSLVQRLVFLVVWVVIDVITSGLLKLLCQLLNWIRKWLNVTILGVLGLLGLVKLLRSESLLVGNIARLLINLPRHKWS